MPFATDADRAVCHDMIKAGSKTFAAASLLMPSDVREAAYAVYAFCRLSDDMVDVEGGSADAIGRLRQRLDWAYAGRPAAASVDRAFADVIAAFNLPRALPEALIDGLEWDVVGVTCDSLDDLYAYAVRVAGSVGAMMSVLMAARDPDTVARACDLGVAMQLTNIARDVGEDARAGRLYLPRSWLRADGLDPEAWLARPEFCPPVGAAIERLLRAADKLYARADAGIRKLPMNCRPAIFAARHLYREIGIEVSRRGLNSISGRARVSRISQILSDRSRRLGCGATGLVARERSALGPGCLSRRSGGRRAWPICPPIRKSNGPSFRPNRLGRGAVRRAWRTGAPDKWGRSVEFGWLATPLSSSNFCSSMSLPLAGPGGNSGRFAAARTSRLPTPMSLRRQRNRRGILKGKIARTSAELNRSRDRLS